MPAVAREPAQSLEDVVSALHDACGRICLAAYGQVFPGAGNVGIFCQSEDEYAAFDALAASLVVPATDPGRKYFALRDPLEVPELGPIPGGRYTHLYIRRPAPDSPERGDIDFVVAPDLFPTLLAEVDAGRGPQGASRYSQGGLALIELRSAGAVPPLAGLAYLSLRTTADAMRIRQPG